VQGDKTPEGVTYHHSALNTYRVEKGADELSVEIW
jgi:hypothetical protein